ncbi:hypothetical protein [Candidatus Uabimicrobium sp. HlEnr_7]|uniref:hypothetical protein n=1 Tax=Candidatus Uabimicrobium helgolandensis TaxID=3095367 RepID=UPI003556A36E
MSFSAKVNKLMFCIDEVIFDVAKSKQQTEKKSIIAKFDNKLEELFQRYFVKDQQVNTKLIIEVWALFFSLISLAIAVLQNSSLLLLVADLAAAVFAVLVIFI